MQLVASVAEDIPLQLLEMGEKLVRQFGPGTPELNAYALATQFHSGALRCLTIIDQPGGGFEMDMAPGIVCLAFTAELYLKTLHLARHGKAPRGHKLHVLLGNLPPDLQGYVGERYALRSGRVSVDFRADIQAFGNAFADWRYVYEGPDSMHLELGRLLQFTSALFEAIQRERPNWPYPNA